MVNIQVEADIDVQCNTCGHSIVAGDNTAGEFITMYADMCPTCLAKAVEEAREGGYDDGFDAGVQSVEETL